MAGKKRKRKQSDQQETDGPGVEELKRAVEEAKRRREEAKRQIEEAKRQIEEAKRVAAEERTRREEAEADFAAGEAAIEALGKGTYFTTYNRLWNAQFKTFGKRNLTNLTRNPRGSGKELREKIPYYENTAKFAGDDNYGVTDVITEARSESTKNNRFNWPRDVLDTTIVDDSRAADENFITEVSSGNLAHLVPASTGHANLHLYVAPLAFGIPDASLECKMKLIHGSKEKDGKRENDVGVKHFPTNKIRLYGQLRYYDNEPNVLIIPILSVRETKAWSGDGYEALFLIGVKQDDFGTNSEAPRLKNIAKVTTLSAVDGRTAPHASQEDIEQARLLLEACILALAYSMKHDVALNKKVWSGISDEVRQEVGCLPSLEKAPCPRPKRGENPRVRKVRFHSVAAGQSRGHPAPDPILLAMKAANNWSTAHGFRLLTGGEESEENKMSDQSVLALEWHMEIVRQAQEHQRNQEISGMEIVLSNVRR